MTSKQIYEATAIELSKVQAPALKLYEFNYFFNQAIRLFVNKVYNVYDVNQQTTDDLRVLKGTATLKPEPAKSTGNKAIDYLHGATYFVNMPDDYLHLLNCICLFDVKQRKDCWNLGDVMVVGATKLTADSWSNIVDDVYNRPTSKRPYYYIHNQNDIHSESDVNNPNVKHLTNLNSELPTNTELDSIERLNISRTWKLDESDFYTFIEQMDLNVSTGMEMITRIWENIDKIKNLDIKGPFMGFLLQLSSDIQKNTILNNPTHVQSEIIKYMNDNPIIITLENNFSRTFNYEGYEIDAIEKPAGSRHANTSKVKVEIRCGRNKSNVFSLSAVQIDYVKAPQIIRLTQEQLDSDEDISQVMEFPDYVNQEIINELVNLVMRKVNDPSLSAHMLMTQSIARPTGQLQQPA